MTASRTPINIGTFVSPTGPDFDPTADVSIYMDKLHNSTTSLNNYAHFVAFAKLGRKKKVGKSRYKNRDIVVIPMLFGNPLYTDLKTAKLGRKKKVGKSTV